MIRNVFICVKGKFVLVFSVFFNFSYYLFVKRKLLVLVLKEDLNWFEYKEFLNMCFYNF